MTVSLGDINFDVLPGLNAYDDVKETIYVELPLAQGKSTLQRTGDKADQVNLTIILKDAFGVPEDQYRLLNQKRLSGEILPFVWGTGEIEGDFVIASINKTMDELGNGGQWKTITCTLKLLESYNPNANKAATDRATMQKAAFATTLNQQRPANIKVSEPSPATDLMGDVQDVDINTQQTTDTLNTNVVQSTVKSTVIDQAQEFVDRSNRESYNINRLITETNDLLNVCNVKLNASPGMQAIAPALSAQIAASLIVTTDAQTLITSYSTMPNPVTTLSDANNVLQIMNSTASMVINLTQALNNLKTASQPLAVAIATRKDV